MLYNNIRNYEVSIWTLQDSFISVLKQSNLENKGQIQDPNMTLKNDGTLEFTFSLPMYIYKGPTRFENPIWYNVRNGNLIANMRKIKVIFNKKTEDEKVFEFLIIKVTEKHEGAELICEVECEGLAFHELGKIGYKISLNQDDYIEEWSEWADESYASGLLSEEEHFAREPKNNINYWCDKVLKDTNWTYSIQMDWASYDGTVIVQFLDSTSSRVLWAIVDKSKVGDYNPPIQPDAINTGIWYVDESTVEVAHTWDEEKLPFVKIYTYPELNKEQRKSVDFLRERLGYRRYDRIYEEPFVSSWVVGENGLLSPKITETFREKYRVFEEKESNIYNLTQTIAETFGVHCRYEYSYDQNYHIIGREVIFYNNFIQESTGVIDITYPYGTEHIEREMDSTDTITKMFVKNLDDETLESGWASIMDTEANRSGEDYILNFDYLHDIRTISNEQYDEVKKYEATMRSLNEEIKPLERKLVALENEYTEVSAGLTIAKNAVSLDKERISAENDWLNQVTKNTGEISITEERPEVCTIRDNNGSYYIELRNKGINEGTIQLYKTKSFNSGEYVLSDSYNNYKKEYDSNGIFTGKITLIGSIEDNISAIYAIYSYTPQSYHEEVRRVWEIRLSQDESELNEKSKRAIELDGEKDVYDNRLTDGEIQEAEQQLQLLYEKKENAIKAFERMMGPALREGNWQPEDNYTNYGDKYTDALSFNEDGNFSYNLSSLGWDNELFDDEEKNYYEEGINQDKKYYPCIVLTGLMDRFIPKKIQTLVDSDTATIESLSFIFTDVITKTETSGEESNEEDFKYLKYLPINSLSKFAFLREKETKKVIPVLMITGAQIYSDNTLSSLIADENAKIGIFSTAISDIDSSIETSIKTLIGPNSPYAENESEKIQWLDNCENYEIVYPRIRIMSTSLKEGDNELKLFLNNSLLHNYVDFYILTRNGEEIAGDYLSSNYITLKPETLFKQGKELSEYSENASIVLNYTISNTSLIMYLDAIQVLKENAYPKVTYTVDPSMTNKNFVHMAYNTLNKIVHINDYELKFDHVQGYISELELDLDHPWEDEITIANYKTDFESLFTSIVAQSEQMQKNSYVIGAAAQAFSGVNGLLSEKTLQDSININGIDYSFNQGNLSITEENGILANSDDGVVAIRGTGIFTATEKDENGDWIWNTGILPSGINASMIKTGQLDTNLIRIFAGNDLRLQMNADGLFAYKESTEDGETSDYVVHDRDGLRLHVVEGEGQDKNEYDKLEISWNGLIIRQNNQDVFYADTNGNLVLNNIRAETGSIGGWKINGEKLTAKDNDEINIIELNAGENGEIPQITIKRDNVITSQFTGDYIQFGQYRITKNDIDGGLDFIYYHS